MEISVYIEIEKGRIRKPSYQMIGGAKKHFPQAKITAIIITDSLTDEIKTLPIDRVIHIKSEKLKDYTAEGYSYAISNVLNELKPDLFFIGATFQGRDMAPRLSAKISLPLVSECTGINADGGNITFIHPMYGGRAISTVRALTDGIIIATVRPNIFPVIEGTGHPEIIERILDIPQDVLKVQVISVEETGGDMPDVAEAPIVVSGGRGMKGPENFKMLEKLARLIGGAIGASRSAVDEGWMPQSHQVGQTGKTISPNLYIACGISGAIQHRAGMSSSKCIVAINTDPDAEIFKIADYGIVKDLFLIIPILTKKLSE
ncbi:MAG: electron transfer flavoprotein subunit alpha/FixB family protein [bacterium]